MSRKQSSSHRVCDRLDLVFSPPLLVSGLALSDLYAGANVSIHYTVSEVVVGVGKPLLHVDINRLLTRLLRHSHCGLPKFRTRLGDKWKECNGHRGTVLAAYDKRGQKLTAAQDVLRVSARTPAAISTDTFMPANEFGGEYDFDLGRVDSSCALSCWEALQTGLTNEDGDTGADHG